MRASLDMGTLAGRPSPASRLFSEYSRITAVRHERACEYRYGKAGRFLVSGYLFVKRASLWLAFLCRWETIVVEIGFPLAWESSTFDSFAHGSTFFFRNLRCLAALSMESSSSELSSKTVTGRFRLGDLLLLPALRGDRFRRTMVSSLSDKEKSRLVICSSEDSDTSWCCELKVKLLALRRRPSDSRPVSPSSPS
ncbi:hypothetical protein PG995_009065 [Apiospora arundinis]